MKRLSLVNARYRHRETSTGKRKENKTLLLLPLLFLFRQVIFGEPEFFDERTTDEHIARR